MKPPFKADPSDVILCHDAENCEPYLAYVEKELQTRQRKIFLPAELYGKLEERARAKGLTPEELATRIILKKVQGGEKHGGSKNCF